MGVGSRGESFVEACTKFLLVSTIDVYHIVGKKPGAWKLCFSHLYLQVFGENHKISPFGNPRAMGSSPKFPRILMKTPWYLPCSLSFQALQAYLGVMANQTPITR